MKIRKVRILDATPEEVWEAITNQEKLNHWFMKAKFKPEVGFEFEFMDTPQGNWDGRLSGKVLEVIAPKKLSYTWQGNQMKNETKVSWLIEAVETGTKLTIEHQGFKGFGDTIIGFFHLFGWKTYLKNLTEYLN